MFIIYFSRTADKKIIPEQKEAYNELKSSLIIKIDIISGIKL